KTAEIRQLPPVHEEGSWLSFVPPKRVMNLLAQTEELRVGTRLDLSSGMLQVDLKHVRQPGRLAPQQRDTVAKVGGLFDIVRNEDYAGSQLLAKSEELILHGGLRHGVECSEWFIHQ